MADLNRLLNQDTINFDIIDKSLKNRSLLLKDQRDYLPLEWFYNLRSTEIQQVTHYYLGNVKEMDQLLCVCDSSFTPLFPKDVIRLETHDEKVELMTSHKFAHSVLDGLAVIDGLATSSPIIALDLFDIKSVKIVSEDSSESRSFYSSIENMDLDIVSGLIKKHTAHLINDVIRNSPATGFLEKSDDSSLDMINLESLDSSDLLKKVRKYLVKYRRSRDVLNLIQIVNLLGRVQST